MAHVRRKNGDMDISADATSAVRRFHATEVANAIDNKMGFLQYEEGPPRIGWLVNFQPTTLPSTEVPTGKAAVDFYFLDEEGGYFKATLRYDPYFLVKCSPGKEADVEEFVKKHLEGTVKEVKRVEREDLSMPNHLIGRRQPLLRLSFWNTQMLLQARKTLMPFVAANQKRLEAFSAYGETAAQVADASNTSRVDASDYILDIREYDVPYHVRVSIDKDVRVGKWYTVRATEGEIDLEEIIDRVARPDPVVLAFDIETTKQPLKFPDAAIDSVMMISYMIDGQGYLITNREVVSQDIDDFEYTPKPEFKGEFTIFNEDNEHDLLMRFFDHIKEEKPTVIVTFNGDFFDWPFVDARATANGISMYEEIGFEKDMEDEYKSKYCAHMDAFRWVKRDSYLPQGSQGLKAVTTAKLGYNPLELDPEKMTPYASERPQVLAEYSVSDAVATYYLYMKYVHPFIFSLCNIIPLRPDEVLRKGTGTLCEMLLMVQAYQKNILLPHKHKDPLERFYNGHLIESETYVGGHVESLEAGIFRNDIETHFKVDPDTIDQLVGDLDAALKFTVITEAKMDINKVENYEEVKQTIKDKLLALKERPSRNEKPLIYHVDVASMYPNIMTTNRLQPDSMVTEKDCAMCDFNRPGKTCDRRLPWSWRGEFFPPERSEYLMIQNTLKKEKFKPRPGSDKSRTYDELPPSEQVALLKQRLSEYSRKVYHKIKQTETIEREAIICQRENPFYVNTVRDFRDRRYEFKGLQKVWKRKTGEIDPSDAPTLEEANKMVVLYDSLQLAHKVILNSFYGYVMRKGSRWYSMEMAGVTCLTGATIIQLARSLVEKLGRPLELDTDGIWCILPESFPGDLCFKFSDGKKLPIAYPCVMLNHLVHAKFTNHQYQTLVDEKTFRYETISDNSIFFEVDGPYKAMVLPTSTEEDKNLKKRYAVFNLDGTLAELKGFELKRRGELRIIKAFQSKIFKEFLEGTTLAECYGAVAKVANSWLDVLDSKGKNLEDEDLMDLISENKVMSKSLKEYEGQKSTSICTARRLAEFLGSQMVKDSGLACHYIISKLPAGAPVTDRAVPVEVFSADYDTKRRFLRSWLKAPGLDNFDPRTLIDWDYYRTRLASTVQKIITIPAALQQVENPVPRVPHPDWLKRRLAILNDRFKQQKISGYFTASEKPLPAPTKPMGDIEDMGFTGQLIKGPKRATVKRKSPTASVDKNMPDLNGPAPDPDEDYGAWLRYMKHVWARRSEQRAARAKLFGDKVGRRHNRGVQGMIRAQVEVAFSSRSWQLLQLRPGTVPGQVLAAIWVNNRIQRIKINVPRTIYIQFDGEAPSMIFPDGVVFARTEKALPDNLPSNNVYELTLPESVYQEELVKADSILKNPSVLGVYEGQIDATDRVLLEVGAQCSLDDTKPGLLGKGLENGFEMSWLKPLVRRRSNRVPVYLEGVKLDYLMLQHYEVSNQHLIVLIPSWAPKGYIVHYGDGSSGSDVKIAAAYAEQLAVSHDLASDYFELQPSLEFEVVDASDLRRFYSKTASIIADFFSERGTQAVLAVQSVRADRLSKLIRTIEDFPTIEIPPSEGVLPSVGWQKALAKRVVKSYLRLQHFLKQQATLAAFSNVPLGNTRRSNDVHTLIDTVYARRLQSENMILWWSKTPLPDWGGRQYDDSAVEMENAELPRINKPGLYQKVCLDLNVANLAVNTILTSSLLNAAEGADLADGGGEGILVQNAFSPSALSALSALVKEWWGLAASGDVAADTFIQSFITWVASPVSTMFDPKLQYHVQNLSKKAFQQLMNELHNYGTQLVMANRNRIVVATTKTHVENTFGFGSFLVKAIKSNPLFTYLDVSISEYWDYLMWLDDSNLCGRICKSLSGDVPGLDHASEWQIAQYLPPILQPEFQEWVFQLMQLVGEAKDRFFSDDTRPTQVVSVVKEAADEEAHFMRGVLKTLEKPLLTRIKLLNRRYIDGRAVPTVAREFEFPKLAGSIEVPADPVLALINSICAVYGLDSALNDEYLRLRRKLLDVVKVGEFSPSAQFRNPAASLVITNAECHHCGHLDDIDVCRPEIADQFAWKCPHCGYAMGRVYLEERLVQMVVHEVTAYQLQDLKCAKCGRARPDDMALYCECSGSFINTIPQEKIQSRLAIFRHVADFFDLRLLQSSLGV